MSKIKTSTLDRHSVEPLNPSNSSNLEQPALKGLNIFSTHKWPVLELFTLWRNTAKIIRAPLRPHSLHIGYINQTGAWAHSPTCCFCGGRKIWNYSTGCPRTLAGAPSAGPHQLNNISMSYIVIHSIVYTPFAWCLPHRSPIKKIPGIASADLTISDRLLCHPIQALHLHRGKCANRRMGLLQQHTCDPTAVSAGCCVSWIKRTDEKRSGTRCEQCASLNATQTGRFDTQCRTRRQAVDAVKAETWDKNIPSLWVKASLIRRRFSSTTTHTTKTDRFHRAVAIAKRGVCSDISVRPSVCLSASLTVALMHCIDTAHRTSTADIEHSVAARGCLPPGANVCVAAPPVRSVLQSWYFSGFRTWGREPTLGVPSSSLPFHYLPSLPLTFSFPALSLPSLKSRPLKSS